MKKSTVIATCLVNSSILNRLEDAEHLVKQVFLKRFPMQNFQKWNSEINERTAEGIIRNVGRAMRLDVKKFIEDLRKIH